LGAGITVIAGATGENPGPGVVAIPIVHGDTRLHFAKEYRGAWVPIAIAIAVGPKGQSKTTVARACGHPGIDEHKTCVAPQPTVLACPGIQTGILKSLPRVDGGASILRGIGIGKKGTIRRRAGVRGHGARIHWRCGIRKKIPRVGRNGPANADVIQAAKPSPLLTIRV
jgi:hypothetical protein